MVEESNVPGTLVEKSPDEGRTVFPPSAHLNVKMRWQGSLASYAGMRMHDGFNVHALRPELLLDLEKIRRVGRKVSPATGTQYRNELRQNDDSIPRGFRVGCDVTAGHNTKAFRRLQGRSYPFQKVNWDEIGDFHRGPPRRDARSWSVRMRAR